MQTRKLVNGFWTAPEGFQILDTPGNSYGLIVILEN